MSTIFKWTHICYASKSFGNQDGMPGRLQIANEKSIKENIKKFIKELSFGF